MKKLIIVALAIGVLALCGQVWAGQKITWEPYVSGDTRTYHFFEVVTQDQADALEQIDGVESAYLQGNKYEILVYKARLHSWGDIHPKIITYFKGQECKGIVTETFNINDYLVSVGEESKIDPRKVNEVKHLVCPHCRALFGKWPIPSGTTLVCPECGLKARLLSIQMECTLTVPCTTGE